MSGVYPALAIHRELSTVAFVAAAIAVVAALLKRRTDPGWGPFWATVGLLVLVTGQTLAGYMAIIWLHVPLAVALTVISIGLAIWSWWQR